MIYLDTNFFAKAVLEGGNAKKVLLEIALGKESAATSLITWDEFLWVLKRHLKNYVLAKSEAEKLLILPNIVFYDLTFEIIKKAQEIVKIYPEAKPRDAIHVASALYNNINTIITDDVDFDQFKGIKRIAINQFHI